MSNKTDQKLTPRQLAFVEEYVIDRNATQAAIRAGYAKRTAYSQGQRLLKHVEVRAEIRARLAEREKRTQINADWVIMQIASIAEDACEKTADRLKALELLGKHLGMFERQVSESDGVRVEIGEAEEWSE